MTTTTRRTISSVSLPFVACCATLLSFTTHASAQTARPALTQLAQDVQSLYREVEGGTVRVRVPLPMLADMQDLRKWEPHLNAELRQRLLGGRVDGPLRIRVEQPATQPTTGAAATQPTTAAIDVDGPIRFDVIVPDFPANEHVGLVLDDKGHVLVNTYIDPRALGGRPIRATSERKTVEAQVVGSDRQTRLTVLRLAEPLGKPPPTSDAALEPGMLVMMLGSGQQGGLLVWTGANREQGLVVNVEGAALGFARGGQVVGASSFKPITEQIIRHGVVKRAKLGTAIEAVAMDDPLRQKIPALGDRPAIRVAEVVPGSAAHAAGVRNSDIVLTLAGEPVTDVFNFAATIARCRGETPLTILRDGEELTINVTLRPE